MTCFGPSENSIRTSQCSVRGNPRPITYDINEVTCPKCRKAIKSWTEMGFVFHKTLGFVNGDIDRTQA